MRNTSPSPAKTSRYGARKLVPNADERQQDFAAPFKPHPQPPLRIKALDQGFLPLFVRRSPSWPKIALPANWAQAASSDGARRLDSEHLDQSGRQGRLENIT
jgi:hypothetical protein